jgi:hypothetical protein
MPEINHRSPNRTTTLGQHIARKFKRLALGGRLTKITSLRRFGLEERPLRLGGGRFIAIATVRRGCKQGDTRTGQFPPGDKKAGVE